LGSTFRGGTEMEAASNSFYRIAAIICVLLLLAPGEPPLWAVQTSPPSAPAQPAAAAATIPNDELDSLVAPVALYPDPLLAQTLVAATYPLEIIQLQQWLGQNSNLKDKALADAVQKQDWDPSIQAMAAFPDLVKQLADNIKWTTDLGNAFLAQQDDVMNAVQRMRQKAQEKGTLKTTEQQTVETKVIENKSVVVIEPSSPDVIYVPSYEPAVVYGAPIYPYPAIAYPAGYYAAGMALSFGFGVAMGAAWGGCCGWNAGWGGNNNININNNNNFISNSNRQNVGNGNRASQRPARGNSSWQHNPQHRGGAPYGNRDTANRFGGTSRGDSMANRQASARNNIDRAGGRTSSGSMDFNGRGASGGNRSGNRAQASTADRGSGSSRSRSGGDRVGNRSVSSSGASRGGGAFGSGGGTSGSGARASSSRGSSSFSGRSGGGGRRSGGGGRR
jgi:Protein of unknown function (DUF3300)